MRAKMFFSATFCQNVMEAKVSKEALARALRRLRKRPLSGKPITPTLPAYRQLNIIVENRIYDLNYIWNAEMAELDCSSLTPSPTQDRIIDRLKLASRLLGMFVREFVGGILGS